MTFTPDRSFLVPPGMTVRTGYVALDRIKLACRERMAVGDVDRAYQKLLQAGPSQPFPCPNGRWEGSTFVIVDGRHAYVGALMLGWDALLVAWTEELS